MLAPPLGSWRPHLGKILDPPLNTLVETSDIWLKLIKPTWGPIDEESMSIELPLLQLQMIDKRLKKSARVHGISAQLHGPSNITEMQDLPVGEIWIKADEIPDELTE